MTLGGGGPIPQICNVSNHGIAHYSKQLHCTGNVTKTNVNLYTVYHNVCTVHFAQISLAFSKSKSNDRKCMQQTITFTGLKSLTSL